MKVRHVNNIIIELEGWEAEDIRDALRGLCGDDEILCDLCKELEKLTEREV